MNKHRLHTCLPAGRDLKTQITQILIIFTFFCVIFTVLTGCEAMRKKFTREKKNVALEQPIYVPVEYNRETMPKETTYRNYFLYWQSWHDELINHLNIDANHKKQIECIEQVILNLEKMKAMLPEDKQKIVDGFIQQSKDIQQKILAANLNEFTLNQLRGTLTQQKMQIMKELSYPKVKDSLK